MSYMQDKLQAWYGKMSDLITIAHARQKYGDKPYTYHLRMVEDKVKELFPKMQPLQHIKVIIAALGHDLLEDTHITKEALIEAGYDSDIVEAIDLVTKKDGVGYNEYLRAITRNGIAWKVKVADTYCNLTESIKCGDARRVRKYSLQLEKLYKLKEEV